MAPLLGPREPHPSKTTLKGEEDAGCADRYFQHNTKPHSHWCTSRRSQRTSIISSCWLSYFCLGTKWGGTKKLPKLRSLPVNKRSGRQACRPLLPEPQRPIPRAPALQSAHPKQTRSTAPLHSDLKNSTKKKKKKNCGKNFPGSPVAKTPCSKCRRLGFNPWSGN